MNKFVGIWKLVSVEEQQADGKVTYPYGPQPAGLLVYDASGKMSVQIMRRDRPALSTDDWHKAAAEEIKSALEGFTAFFGSYEVNEGDATIVHRVEGHLFANSVGKSLGRLYEFSGNHLILRPTANRRVTWERIASS